MITEIVFGVCFLILVVIGISALIVGYNTISSSKHINPIQCDCMESLKYLFISKAYLERLLIIASLNNDPTVDMTIERLQALHTSIAQSLQVTLALPIDSIEIITTALNRWDQILIQWVIFSSLDTSLQQEMALQEDTIVKAINKSDLLPFMSKYRELMIKQLQNQQEGHYASSYINLDNGIELMIRFSNKITKSV